jgi:hypothetical protein
VLGPEERLTQELVDISGQHNVTIVQDDDGQIGYVQGIGQC